MTTDSEERRARRARARQRKEYEAWLLEHPSVRALSGRRYPQRPAAHRRSVPNLVAEAMQVPDVETAVMAMRRPIKFYRGVVEMHRRRLRHEQIPLKDERALIRGGEGIEHSFQGAVRAALKAARADAELTAYSDAIASRPSDTQIPENLPSYLSRSELAATRYVGIPDDEVNDYLNHPLSPHRREIVELMRSGKLGEVLEGLEKVWSRPGVSESLRKIVKAFEDPGFTKLLSNRQTWTVPFLDGAIIGVTSLVLPNPFRAYLMAGAAVCLASGAGALLLD